MRNAKITSYKVKGSFQHNCSMFASRKISPLFAWASFTEPSRWCCVLLEQKTKPIFHFVAIIFLTLYVSPARRWEYLKNDEKFFFVLLCPPVISAFFIYLRKIILFPFLVSVIIEQQQKKTPNDDSIQIWNLWVFVVMLCVELCPNFLMASTEKNSQP